MCLLQAPSLTPLPSASSQCERNPNQHGEDYQPKRAGADGERLDSLVAHTRAPSTGRASVPISTGGRMSPGAASVAAAGDGVASPAAPSPRGGRRSRERTGGALAGAAGVSDWNRLIRSRATKTGSDARTAGWWTAGSGCSRFTTTRQPSGSRVVEGVGRIADGFVCSTTADSREAHFAGFGITDVRKCSASSREPRNSCVQNAIRPADRLTRNPR
jgi:hypothetical protein